MKSIHIFIISLQLIGSCFLGTCSAPNDLPEFEAYIDYKLDRDNIPGLAVAIVSGDELVYTRGFGLASIEKNIPVRPQTVFGTASITKSFTAIAVFQLIEQGRLNLKSPINAYLPFEVRSSWHPDSTIFLEQVLSHTSGISNGPALWRTVFCGDSKISLEAWNKGYFTEGGEYWHPEGNFERWPAGTGFQYSNAGYGLLAYMVERVSGEPFADYIRNHILEPLEMTNASIRLSDIDPQTLTQMYEWGDLWGFEYDLLGENPDTLNLNINPRFTPICSYNDPALGAGSLYSSVVDLANFLIMIKNGGLFRGKRIVSEASLKMMYSGVVDQEIIPPWFSAFGMGGYAMPLSNNKPVWGHTGADPGMSSIMFYEPETDLGVIVLANRFYDIRDLITWSFASAIPAFCDSQEKLNDDWYPYTGVKKGVRQDQHIVRIQVKPDFRPNDEKIYMNGNHQSIGLWTGKGLKLKQHHDSLWTTDFTVLDSTWLAFRITRGSWENMQVDLNGETPPHHKVTISRDTTLGYHVQAWRDSIPPKP